MIKLYKVNKEHPELLHQLNKKNSFGTILIYSDYCPHCASMKPQWEQMKKQMNKKSANIYEINSDDLPFINHPIKNIIDGYPMILNVNNREIVPFEQERTLDNLIRFVESNIINLKPIKKTKPIRGNQIGNSLNLNNYIDKKRITKSSKQIKSKRSYNKTTKRRKKSSKKSKSKKMVKKVGGSDIGRKQPSRKHKQSAAEQPEPASKKRNTGAAEQPEPFLNSKFQLLATIQNNILLADKIKKIDYDITKEGPINEIKKQMKKLGIIPDELSKNQNSYPDFENSNDDSQNIDEIIKKQYYKLYNTLFMKSLDSIELNLDSINRLDDDH